GDGDRRHVSGHQRGVRGLIGEVVARDIGTVAGEADDLDVDESVLVDQLRHAQSGCGPGTHGGEQDVGLGGQGTELLRTVSSLEVDPADLLTLGQLPIVFGDGALEGVPIGRFDLDHPGAELRQSCRGERSGQIDGEREHRDSVERRLVGHPVSSGRSITGRADGSNLPSPAQITGFERMYKLLKECSIVSDRVSTALLPRAGRCRRRAWTWKNWPGTMGPSLPSRAGKSKHAQEQARGRFGKAGVRTWQRQPPRTDHKTAAGTSPVAPASAMPASTSSRSTASPALPCAPSPPRRGWPSGSSPTTSARRTD